MPHEHLYFFLGGDPAPSETQRSDHSAFVVSAATPRSAPEPNQPLSSNAADWHFDPVYARRFTSKEKISVRQMSGYVHKLHRQFRFTKIVLDPNQGGVYMQRELVLPRQFFDGADQDVMPIADQKEGPTKTVTGDFILHLWKRGDPGVEECWPNLPGDDNLNDVLYSQTKEALDHGQVGMVPHKKEWLADPQLREQLRQWPEERFWALVNLGVLQEQLCSIMVATHEDGTQKFTKRNARQFDAVGKKDFVSAFMYSRMGFLMWLKNEEWGGAQDPEDECGFSGRRAR